MRPSHILETCLCAGNLAAAEDFYSRVLGLEVHSRQEGRHVFFRCGTQMLLLFNPRESCQSSEAGVPPHGTIGAGHLAFAAREADLPAWQSHLEASGVAIEKIVAWPGGGHSLYFRDPAGNSLEIATPRIWSISEETLEEKMTKSE